MDTLVKYLCVGSAGFAGAIARYFMANLCAHLLGTDFPFGTLVINLSGSFVLGYFTAVVGRAVVPEPLRLAVAVGFIGAYTTFSTFMFESDALLRGGAVNKAIFNLVGSVVLGLLCVRLGWILGTR